MSKVNYGARAKLYLMPNGTGFLRGGSNYDGNLVGAVKRFMELDPLDYQRAHIGFDVGTIEGNESGLIHENEIRALFKRADFPH